MTKQELVAAATNILKEQNARKPMRTDKHRFVISDESGSKAEFDIQMRNTEILYNQKDVSIILDACLDAITDSIRNGEPVIFRGFGTWKLNYRAARRTKRPGTEEWVDVADRYVPKFQFGNDLRMAAQTYEYIKNDRDHSKNIPDPIYDEGDY